MSNPDQNDLAEAVALAAQLTSNADSHSESSGTERRRAAETIESLVAELNALYPRWSAMTSRSSDWQIRAMDAEAQLADAWDKGVRTVWSATIDESDAPLDYWLAENPYREPPSV